VTRNNKIISTFILKIAAGAKFTQCSLHEVVTEAPKPYINENPREMALFGNEDHSMKILGKCPQEILGNWP
jgi:hypothetical protein